MTISGVTRGLQFVAVLAILLSCDPARATDRTILVFGDSISAAHGMDIDQGWVHLLSQRLKAENSPFRVVNASVSGETTGGGVVRLPKTLRLHQPSVVVLELGGNDGLRGYPVDDIRRNLVTMTRMAQGAGAKVLLIGMVLPPNYGERYIDAFVAMYPVVARTCDVPLLPVLLDGIHTPARLMQSDGIHPTPAAQPMILDQVWQRLAPILKQVELKPHVAAGK